MFFKIFELFDKVKIKKIGIFLFIFLMGIYFFMNSSVSAKIEDKIIYYPINNNAAPVRITPEESVQDIYFCSRDGIKLNGWYIKAKGDEPTVIYCHGQGENLSQWQNVAQMLADNGYGVFMIDYRGHGKSEGCPFESGLYIDLESSINYLVNCKKADRNNIILWGRSLGGAVVADVASRDKYKAVILESTFTNLRDEAIHLTSTGIAESEFGFWSALSTKFVKFFPITQKFATDTKIFRIKSPLLIGGSANDTTVPVKMSYKLGTLNPQAKLFISDKGSHHESEWFFPEVINFLKSVQ